MTMRVAVAMTSHNRRELTLRCLASLRAQEGDRDLRVVLVDDGSTDGTAGAVADSFPDATVLTGDGHLFWAAGMAVAEVRALELSPDVILWLNDDVELDPHALTTLAKTSATTNPNAVVVGSVCDPKSQQVSYGGLSVSRWHPLRVTRINPCTAPQAVDTFNGNVVWIPVTAIRRVGGIDGEFPHAYADLDLGLRLRSASYPVLLAPGTLGSCPRNQLPPTAPRHQGIRARLRALDSPKGLPLRAQIRFLRRHGPVYWPVLSVVPYAKAVLRRR